MHTIIIKRNHKYISLKILISLLLFFCINQSRAQESNALIIVVQNLTLQNDSLKKEINKQVTERALLNDSINNLYSEQLKLKQNILNKDSEIKELSKQNIKNERDRAIRERDSITTIRDTLRIKLERCKSDNDIFKKECEAQKADYLKKGKEEVINQILKSYNASFEQLITSCNLSSLNRDISIVGSNTAHQQNFLNLITYFEAESLLNEKYNEAKVKSAISKLNALEKTESVKKLTENLKNYELNISALKDMLDKIIKIDQDFVANNYNTAKFLDILSEVASYYRNYYFEYNDNPYLSNIILELIKVKQKNANTDISYLKSRL
jgi:hypothetical protein